VLLEMVIAMSIFVGGAALLSQLHSSITHAIERARLTTEATDLARKALAELETGIITVADLRTLRVCTERSVSRQERDSSAEEMSPPTPWQLSVRTERSPYAGLTLVELTVTYVEPGAEAAFVNEFGGDERQHADNVRVTLRQLIRLRDDGGDETSSTGREEGAGW
jgi:type II secretory pathway pseudopilin PulG